MKKLLILLGIAFASQLFMACSMDDNPVDSANLDNPQEVVTDQPANAPQR